MAGSLRDPNVQAAIQAARIPPAGTPVPYASPADWRDGWIYFLMVDRFNNPGHLPVHQPYDDPNYFKYQGGTFRGVQAQLQYIKDLGASAIWIIAAGGEAASRGSAFQSSAGAASWPPGWGGCP